MNSPLQAWVRALERTAPIERGGCEILPVLIEQLAARAGERIALSGRHSQLSYAALTQAAAQCSGWALAQGLARGDVIGLLMQNRPEYLAIWLGLTRIGVVVALLNTHLRGELLERAIALVTPRGVIADAAHEAPLVAAQLPAAIARWAYGASARTLPRIDEPRDPAPSGGQQLHPALDDPALYIYTSGTTGFPKAAVVTHRRLLQWTHWFAGMMDILPSDRMFNCLPLYHSVGGVVATGATLVGGGTVVLRERFSASEFWSDLRAERCTLFQYIGELCRYLLASPPQPLEAEHHLRLACGNGLRAEVWGAFQQRFRIPRILEYYAATEGSFSLYNCEGRPGSIGRIPPFIAHRLTVALVRVDPEGELPLRDAQGRCIRCAPGEPGEALGLLQDARGKVRSRFEGYTDAEASQRKILRDVFEPGDAWFRTGDLLRQDADGFFYFVDRLGESFRWKGENVSTAEVAAVLESYPGIADAAVYGVRVPGHDGRAGMAALLTTEGFSLAGLRRHLDERLPGYAQPLFVRIVAQLALTGTFKLQKRELAAQGFEPQGGADSLYVADRRAQSFIPLDRETHELICRGRFAL
ncbi:MAG TPA: long-chain-acyl-CoA synthetase [Steroidobacteraceae bacterium]|nr:long-chain-acyl-CoA synthetase [Steroidobacteraceae bacterium]